MKATLSAGLALAACFAFADATVSEQFSSTPATKWTSATVNDAPSAGTIGVGSAINATENLDLARSGNKVYPVSGIVTCTTGCTDSGYGRADFLIYVEEAGDVPDAEDAAIEGAHLAVAAGPQKNGAADGTSEIYVYCKNGDTAGWQASGASVSEEAWHRVTLQFDYANNKGQVCVDGEPVNTSFGTQESTNSVSNGSWFTLATTASAPDAISTLTFVGASEIDDVLVESAVNAPVNAAYAFAGSIPVDDTGSASVSIPRNYLARHSIVTTDANANVADAYECGLDPNATPVASEAFKATAATLTTITVPCIEDNGQTYSIVFSDGTNTRTLVLEAGNVGEISNGSRVLTFVMPTTADDGSTPLGRVLTFQVRATKE